MNSTEPRRIIKFGNSSYVISLPISWVKENNLKKGDLVYLEKNGKDELVILPTKHDTGNNGKEIVIDAANKDAETLKREITSAYSRDFAKLIIKNGADSRELIDRTFSYLTGLNVSTNVNGEIIAQDILNAKEISINNVEKEIGRTVRMMLKLFRDGISSKTSIKLSKDIEILDKGVNKSYFLIRRLHRRGCILDNPGDDKFHKLLSMVYFSLNMEQIGDEIKAVARLLSNTRLNADDLGKTIKITSMLDSSFATVLESYFNEDIDLALNSMTTVKYKIIKQCNSLIKTSSNKNIEDVAERLKSISRHMYYILKVVIY